MSDILRLAQAHIVAAVRERVTLFWFLIFPIFLLTILTLIFGGSGQEGSVHFEIALLNRDTESVAESFSTLIETTFAQLSSAPEDGPLPLFTIHRRTNLPADAFLEAQLSALRSGQRAAIIEIPVGFHSSLLAALSSGGVEASPAPQLQLHMSQANVASETAAAIIEQILAELNREILIQANVYDRSQMIVPEIAWVGQKDDGVTYVDSLLPAVILMGFFTNGLFGVPGTILFNRDRKVLRRYWVTPLSVPRYLAGFSIGHLSLCVVQFGLLYGLGRFVFGATVRFGQPDTVLLLVLAAITFMAFGFLIASIAKSANASMAIANILNMPMMFLSGMFFPIAGLPAFMLVLVYANPVSYLLEGLRHSVGVQANTLMPQPLTYLIPLVWILAALVLSRRRLHWDVAK